ncbi:MAG: glycosyltransferase family 2 protein [Candidatus Dormibacteraeota bacterium]|nr:glycosyltransferase family 2 protein [Candidatus Dormibacteraeota bacterium]MBO0743785.1 glycosyltransferase family 2 protein [Candidatus Dormibacteraeota bacterium]
MSAAPAPPLEGLSLVLPVHNEAVNLPFILQRAAEALPKLAGQVELVVVDDGSTDGSGELARARAAELGLDLRVVTHRVKSGYGITVADGLRAARMPWVAFTDADGQFDIADVARLAARSDQADLIGGWRIERQDARMRSVVSGTFNVLLFLLYGLRVRDVDCALKLIRGEFLRSIELENRSALLNAELYLKARMGRWRVVQVPVPHYPRRAGRRSGARPKAILRAIKELIWFRVRLAFR